ncbi:hypothetical protein [Pseudomonas sivasensis]|uniref:Uncharacterized protein n=1 Tax=Pseudomonas sivasensis TaxID=1880678 RepID=A0ABW8E2Q5_9PSED
MSPLPRFTHVKYNNSRGRHIAGEKASCRSSRHSVAAVNRSTDTCCDASNSAVPCCNSPHCGGPGNLAGTPSTEVRTATTCNNTRYNSNYRRVATSDYLNFFIC